MVLTFEFLLLNSDEQSEEAMPTYEYECLNCGHHFEISQSMSDEPIKKCPKCKKIKLKRLIGPGAGIIFKGSGFYATDYKKSKRGSKEGKSQADKTCHSCPSSNCPHANK